jgi:hypothetical protein
LYYEKKFICYLSIKYVQINDVGLAEKQQISIFGVTQPGSNPQSFNT